MALRSLIIMSMSLKIKEKELKIKNFNQIIEKILKESGVHKDGFCQKGILVTEMREWGEIVRPKKGPSG